MAKTPTPPKPAPPAPALQPTGWVVLHDGWYCGRAMRAGDPVTHVGLEQLLADEGQRVERRPASAES